MSTDNTPQITMIPVKRYDVTLGLGDIFTPLTQTATNLSRAGMVHADTAPEVAQLLQRFTDLVTQLNDVVSQIDRIDPTLLASKPGPPPSA